MSAFNHLKDMIMESRLAYKAVVPEAYQAMRGVENFVRNCGLEKSLLELVRLRASQINGCAFCIDMHTKDARAGGESEQRLYLLSAWKEAPFFDARERAALEWTEAITLLANNHVSEELYLRVRRQFSEKEMVNLTMAIVSINGWNRLAVAFGSVAGQYQPGKGGT